MLPLGGSLACWAGFAAGAGSGVCPGLICTRNGIVIGSINMRAAMSCDGTGGAGGSSLRARVDEGLWMSKIWNVYLSVFTSGVVSGAERSEAVLPSGRVADNTATCGPLPGHGFKLRCSGGSRRIPAIPLAGPF